MNTEQYDPLKMKITSGILMKYTAEESDVVLPRGIIGIAAEAFEGLQNILESVKIPEGVLWIGPRAFCGCVKLHNISFPESLVEISNGAFYGCGELQTLLIPSSVYRIGSCAFSECSALSYLECCKGVVKIEASAFEGDTNLSLADLPASCTFIEESAFCGCESLMIQAPTGSEAEAFAESAGIRFKGLSSTVSLDDLKAAYGCPESGFVVRNGVLAEYLGSASTIEIPQGVYVIGEDAFLQNYQLVSVKIPESVRIIGVNAFGKCTGLNGIAYSGSFCYFADYAFADCERLETVVLFCGGAEISPHSFDYCSGLHTVIFPDTRLFVKNDAFDGCTSVNHIKLPVRDFRFESRALPKAENISFYLSCQCEEYEKIAINSSATVYPYAYNPRGYFNISKHCGSRGNTVGTEDEIPRNISPFLIKYADQPSGAQAVPASSSSKTYTAPKSYKDLVEIADLPEPMKCDITLDGEIISNEQISRHFVKYFIETMRKGDHNVGLAIHTGSEVFNAVFLAIATIEALCRDSATSSDIVSALMRGEQVLYYPSPTKPPQKYIFDGLDKDGMMRLIKNDRNKTVNMLPKSSWNKISPYYGNATGSSDVGLRGISSQKAEFYKSVLRRDVSKSPNASVVVLLSKTEADRYWKGIGLRYGENEYRLSDIATAAYYTESNIYNYAGNAGKIEPVIKFTDNVNKARELTLDRSGNQTVGALILSAEYFDRSYGEISDIVSKKDVSFVYSSVPLSRIEAVRNLENDVKPSVFACSPEYIEKHLDEAPIFSQCGLSHTDGLRKQLLTVKKRNIDVEFLPGRISEKEYTELREKIKSFKNSEDFSDQKLEFIKKSFSALKVLMSAPFPVGEFRYDSGKSLFETIDQLTDLTSDFPGDEKKKADDIKEALSLLYLETEEDSGKQNAFENLLKKYEGGIIALIVPIEKYRTVMYSCSEDWKKLIDDGRLIITTPNRFDAGKYYDAIIFLGNATGKSFSPQSCFSSENIIGLFYECEKYSYASSINQTKKLQGALFGRSFFPIENTHNYETVPIDQRLLDFDRELSDFIDRVETDYLTRQISRFSRDSETALSKTAAVAFFDTGEKAFFTKNYVPYVFDEEKGEISEGKVSDLSAGDLLVFNTDYSGTRDIVDILLENEIEGGNVSESLRQSYRDSGHWKEVLRDYSSKHGKGERKIAEELKKSGVSVEIQTIIGWIDKDSHTVGPRDPAVFQHIGALVDDNDLFSHPDRFVKACKDVRKKRGDILKKIAEAMVSILGGVDCPDSIPAEFRDTIGRLATLYRIDSIKFVEYTLPSGFTNRPINDNEM